MSEVFSLYLALFSKLGSSFLPCGCGSSFWPSINITFQQPTSMPGLYSNFLMLLCTCVLRENFAFLAYSFSFPFLFSNEVVTFVIVSIFYLHITRNQTEGLNQLPGLRMTKFFPSLKFFITLKSTYSFHVALRKLRL